MYPIREVECLLLEVLARSHAWSRPFDVRRVAARSNVVDERRARAVARNELPTRPYVGYHPGRDQLFVDGQPGDRFARDLYDCGWSPTDITATLGDYQDVF